MVKFIVGKKWHVTLKMKDLSKSDKIQSFFREIHFPKNDTRLMNRKCWQKGRVFDGGWTRGNREAIYLIQIV